MVINLSICLSVLTSSLKSLSSSFKRAILLNTSLGAVSSLGHGLGESRINQIELIDRLNQSINRSNRPTWSVGAARAVRRVATAGAASA